MIIGFLGKGGSGKSSASTQMALYLNNKNKLVLAIDADHNMDLSYNLAGGENLDLQYLGSGLSDLSKAAGLQEGERYSEAFLNTTPNRFTFDSEVVKKYSVDLENGIRLMAAGPQTDTVLYGKSCSHILTTPLKLLLPLLTLEENEMVVVDEKAGADGVTTGIVTGIDVGVIVCEPALHSVKTAKQIAELMNFYRTPYVFVGNKVSSDSDVEFIEEQLGEKLTATLGESKNIKRKPSEVVLEWSEEFEKIEIEVAKLNKSDRLERTIEKFEKSAEFAN